MKSFKQRDVLAAGVFVFLLLLLATCVYSARAEAETVIETGFMFEFDDPKVFGANPTGAIRLKQTFWESYAPLGSSNWYIEYEHHSSVRDEDDRNVFDAIGIGVEWRFGKKGCVP